MTTATVCIVRGFGDLPTPVASLCDAVSEPPLCAESCVVDLGGACLAESLRDGDAYHWELTVPGRARIEREIRGAA